jgi:hypothetical protein
MSHFVVCFGASPRAQLTRSVSHPGLCSPCRLSFFRFGGSEMARGLEIQMIEIPEEIYKVLRYCT